MIWLWSEKAKLKKKKIWQHILTCIAMPTTWPPRSPTSKVNNPIMTPSGKHYAKQSGDYFLKLTKSISKCKQIDRFDEFLKLFLKTIFKNKVSNWQGLTSKCKQIDRFDDFLRMFFKMFWFFWHVFVSSSNCAFFFFSCILSRQCLKYAMFWSFSVENPWMRFVALSGTLKNCPNSRDCCSIWNCRPPCPLFQIHYDSKQLF